MPSSQVTRVNTRTTVFGGNDTTLPHIDAPWAIRGPCAVKGRAQPAVDSVPTSTDCYESFHVALRPECRDEGPTQS